MRVAASEAQAKLAVISDEPIPPAKSVQEIATLVDQVVTPSIVIP